MGFGGSYLVKKIVQVVDDHIAEFIDIRITEFPKVSEVMPSDVGSHVRSKKIRAEDVVNT